MTPKQFAYATHRAAGYGRRQAAIRAGYSQASAKVSASRNERQPAIKAAIADARTAAKPVSADVPALEFDSAQDYLRAVVRGETAPDPVRCGAARALLPFERARQRAPLKGPTPRALDLRDKQAVERDLLDDWAATAAKVRARLRGTAK